MAEESTSKLDTKLFVVDQVDALKIGQRRRNNLFSSIWKGVETALPGIGGE